jgi:hypothetical protein
VFQVVAISSLLRGLRTGHYGFGRLNLMLCRCVLAFICPSLSIENLYQRAGHVPVSISVQKEPEKLDSFSFRNPPAGSDLPPALSAPVGHRAILAEVRAPLPPRRFSSVAQPHQGSTTRATIHERNVITTNGQNMSFATSMSLSKRTGETMSRGALGGRSKVDPFTWLSVVRLGETKESSVDTGSAPDSESGSRSSVREKPPSELDSGMGASGNRQSNDSKDKISEREGDVNQSLQDE